ncbi:hypothetical protein BOX15_Mlig021059g1, partial [Macrostomum lignano]
TRRLGNLLLVWSGGLAIGTAAAAFSGSETFYRDVAMPSVHRLLDPETAHRLAIWGLARAPSWLLTSTATQAAPQLSIKAFNRDFPHPVGLAAGFDKDAQAVDSLFRLGFSFVEVGSVTPLPQPGNPKPRVFRLSADSAIINRYGFNSCGHEQALVNLRSASASGWVGVNLGANKSSSDPAGDYALGARKFASTADYLVINVSSPNTPGVRDLQRRQKLQNLLAGVLAAADEAVKLDGWKGKRGVGRPPVLLKISPDCSDQELADICAVAESVGADGLIISNTTVSRPSSLSASSDLTGQAGGLSGQPLAVLANRAISSAYRLTGGRMPIIGVGGLCSGADALEKLESGACLLQLYTALVYEGPPVVNRINRELEALLKAKGYRSVADAVGAKHRAEKCSGR